MATSSAPLNGILKPSNAGGKSQRHIVIDEEENLTTNMPSRIEESRLEEEGHSRYIESLIKKIDEDIIKITNRIVQQPLQEDYQAIQQSLLQKKSQLLQLKIYLRYLQHNRSRLLYEETEYGYRKANLFLERPWELVEEENMQSSTEQQSSEKGQEGFYIENVNGIDRTYVPFSPELAQILFENRGYLEPGKSEKNAKNSSETITNLGLNWDNYKLHIPGKMILYFDKEDKNKISEVFVSNKVLEDLLRYRDNSGQSLIIMGFEIIDADGRFQIQNFIGACEDQAQSMQTNPAEEVVEGSSQSGPSQERPFSTENDIVVLTVENIVKILHDELKVVKNNLLEMKAHKQHRKITLQPYEDLKRNLKEIKKQIESDFNQAAEIPVGSQVQYYEEAANLLSSSPLKECHAHLNAERQQREIVEAQNKKKMRMIKALREKRHFVKAYYFHLNIALHGKIKLRVMDEEIAVSQSEILVVMREAAIVSRYSSELEHTNDYLAAKDNYIYRVDSSNNFSVVRGNAFSEDALVELDEIKWGIKCNLIRVYQIDDKKDFYWVRAVNGSNYHYVTQDNQNVYRIHQDGSVDLIRKGKQTHRLPIRCTQDNIDTLYKLQTELRSMENTISSNDNTSSEILKEARQLLKKLEAIIVKSQDELDAIMKKSQQEKAMQEEMNSEAMKDAAEGSSGRVCTQEKEESSEEESRDEESEGVKKEGSKKGRTMLSGVQPFFSAPNLKLRDLQDLPSAGVVRKARSQSME